MDKKPRIQTVQGVNYELKNSSRAKRIRLTVYSDGRTLVAKPKRFALHTVHSFVQSRLDWIQKKLAQFAKRKPRVVRRALVGEYAQYKKTAYKLAVSRLQHYNQYYGFTWYTVTIKNQKTRWGSCSATGNLNFNYKIALLPAHLADYIVVHELCHLSQFNHSPNFWALVERTVPGYKSARRELKAYGLDEG